ncbi:MAG TPA: ATP-binding protein [Ignavibacteriaceae bacterium]|nr:ATP-binding protein [Ignavibacteriaceae bacterium]
MWNDLKLNLSSAKIFLSEFLIFDAVFIFIFIFVIEPLPGKILLIIIILALSLFFLNLIGGKRLREMNEIKNIISNIRNNNYKSAEEIHLGSSLRGIEEEIKEMFIKARSDVEYLKRLERIRTEFLGNVSHELRTPIFSIQGYIETLLNGAINDEKVNKNFLAKANQHTINLNNLLNDLIDISMIESGEMRMSFRYFPVKEYLEHIVTEMKPVADEKNISLILLPVKEKLQLFGDKNKLKQVLVNLLINAVKYTEAGSITISVEEEEDTGRIAVRDTGIGIPQEDISRIFERFFRVDKARSRSVGGTGLGLAIVKHIIEAHGSKVEVKSEPGKGTEFSFRLKK